MEVGINEQRFVMTDHVWQRLAPHLPGKAGDAGGRSKDHRLFLETFFWRFRTSSPWRDLLLAFSETLTARFAVFDAGEVWRI